MHGLETIIHRNANAVSPVVDIDALANSQKASRQARVNEAADALIKALNDTMPQSGDYVRREDFREERDSIVAKVGYVRAIRDQAFSEEARIRGARRHAAA